MSTKNQETAVVQADKKKVSEAEKKERSSSSEKKAKPNKIEEFVTYLNASRAELRKVSWPTYKETRATSLVVFGFVAVMAILLGLVDLGLSSLMSFILSV